MDRCQICKLNHLTEDHECYICHQKGINSHKFITCPNRCKFCGGSHTISGHECFICHQKGPDSHDFLDCSEKYKFWNNLYLTKDHGCPICHQKGENSHHYMECPHNPASLSSIGHYMFGNKNLWRIEKDKNLPELEPIEGMLNNLKECLNKEGGPEIIYGDTDSVMFKVSSVEEMEKLNKYLETHNDLELVSEKSFEFGFLRKNVYQS